MWTPRSFRVDDLERLHELIRSNPFGLLVSLREKRLFGTHIPFMVEATGPRGTLVGHMARANPHWKSWTPATEVLVVFGGPHAYISPGWYEERVTVPTWNYAAVHVYGRPQIVEESEALRAMVVRLTGLYEPRSGGWSVEEAEPVMARELLAIVGFRIPIDRIEGKFKFNQNRSAADQRGVVRALAGSSDESERGVAAIMEDNLARGAETDAERARRPDAAIPSQRRGE